MNTTSGLLKIKSVQDLADEEEKKRNAENTQEPNMEIINSLSAYCEKKWTDAKKVKQEVEDAMIADILQRKGEYDAKKIAELKSAKQPEIFMNITDTKCRNAVAWIKDTMFQPGARIFGVEPTPIPDLPPEIAEKVQKEVLQRHIQAAVVEIQQTGQTIPATAIREMVISQSKEIQDQVKHEIVRISKQLAEDISTKIDDDWVEGGYYEALNQIIDDIVGLKAGIMKGPIFRKIKIKRTVTDAQGKMMRKIEEKIVPQYERRSPFSVYPSPHSTDINNGYLFDVLVLRPKQLYDLIGVEGYNVKAIRDVLVEFNSGQLKNDWLGLTQNALYGMGEDDPTKSTSQYPQESIHCLELWDDIPGNLLKEWGLEVEDEDNEYSCCVWKIGKHVIKAMLNYDVLGRKPYTKTSFQNVNDSFWGRDLPELIGDCQVVCNACARNILSNIGMGALPQVVVNVDRLEPNAPRDTWPGRRWDVTDEQMASGNKPVDFFQPVMVTEKLMNVYSTFSKIADEHSGVPAYAHGDSQVGGGGNTASGLNQLITQAARGIKAVIRNIDIHIIEPDLAMHYDYLLDNQDIYSLVGDYKMVAKGTSYLLQKEQQAMRKIEYINNTSNPIDVQLIGADNRRKMLFDVAKNLGIELDESIIPPARQIGAPQGQLPPGSAPQPAPTPVDEAGNPTQGVDERTQSPGSAPQQMPIQGRERGGSVNAGQPYMVGEQGPEVVVPKQDATVLPNDNTFTDITPQDIDKYVKDVAGIKNVDKQLKVIRQLKLMDSQKKQGA